METNNENLRQLLEMLDHPEAYTEQEIRDIIGRDEETRAAYRMMVEAKRASRHRQADKPVDVDAAWASFNEKLKAEREKSAATRISEPSKPQLSVVNHRLRKVAAAVAGVVLVSGIAWAAVQMVRYAQADEPAASIGQRASIAANDTLRADTVAVPQPVVFDNVPLEKMLPEIAARYDATVVFANADARQLRFRFVWNPQKGLEQVVSDLNQFERLTVTLKEKQITVE